MVVRAGDSLEDLLLKVETAVIIGTYQSMLVNFRYVRDIWKRNQEEERLLVFCKSPNTLSLFEVIIALQGNYNFELCASLFGLVCGAEYAVINL